MEIKYIKSAARVLNRNCVTKRGLDLSKNALWISVGQGAADLRSVKVGGQKKILPRSRSRTRVTRARPNGRFFFKPPTLTAHRSAAP